MLPYGIRAWRYLELLLLRDLGAEELVVEDLELELNGITAGLRGENTSEKGRW